MFSFQGLKLANHCKASQPSDQIYWPHLPSSIYLSLASLGHSLCPPRPALVGRVITVLHPHRPSKGQCDVSQSERHGASGHPI